MGNTKNYKWETIAIIDGIQNKSFVTVCWETRAYTIRTEKQDSSTAGGGVQATKNRVEELETTVDSLQGDLSSARLELRQEQTKSNQLIAELKVQVLRLHKAEKELAQLKSHLD